MTVVSNIQNYAVKENGLALQYVKNKQTPKIVKVALKNTSKARQYVEEDKLRLSY